MKPAIAVAAAMALATASLAGSGATATTAEANEDSKKEKRICRTSKMTGSLTRRTRICMTEAEWRELADRTRKGVGEMQNSASGAPACISSHDAACGTAAGPGGVMPGM